MKTPSFWRRVLRELAQPYSTLRGPAARLTVSRALLEALRDDEPCWHDHAGRCQAHNFALAPGEPCPQVELKALLDR
jgi:hypothetical protein